MTNVRITTILLALTAVAGCTGAFFTSRPSTPGQYAAIEAAKASSVLTCKSFIAEKLKTTTVEKIAVSLDALSGALAHSDPSTLSANIAAIDVHSAPFASPIAAIAYAAIATIPDDQAEATYFIVIRGLIDGCGAGLRLENSAPLGNS